MSSSAAAVDRLLHRSILAAEEGFSGAEARVAGPDTLATRPRTPAGSAAGRFDLAVLPVPDKVADVAKLASVLGRSVAATMHALQQPGGLILRNLDSAAVRRFDLSIRAVQGVQLDLSEPQTAIYDLFGKVGPDVQRDLERLGLTGCMVTGATAVAMDCGTAEWLRRRHGKVALDRRFQRFDLILDEAFKVLRDRVVDFIGLRAGIARSDLLQQSQTSPIRLERSLKRAAACQFAADYAEIGLNAQLRLTGVE